MQIQDGLLGTDVAFRFQQLPMSHSAMGLGRHANAGGFDELRTDFDVERHNKCLDLVTAGQRQNSTNT